MDKFRLVIIKESLNDVRVLDMLINYFKDKYEEDGLNFCEYELSENIYKAVRSVIQGELKKNFYSYLYSDKQIIVLFNKKHFRIDKGSDELWELMLAYAKLQNIDSSRFDGLKEKCGGF